MKRMTCADKLGIRTEELQRAGAEVVIEETEDLRDRRHQVVAGQSSQEFQAPLKCIANYRITSISISEWTAIRTGRPIRCS